MTMTRMPLFALLCANIAFALCTTAQAKINKFALVAPGVYRGAQPETDSDYGILRALGVRTILNLRNDNVETDRKIAAELGFNYVSIPMDGFFGTSKEKFDEAVDVLSDPSARPVFVHCHYGQDRTGVTVGLYRLFIDHWTPKEAYHEMRNFGYDFLLLGLDADFWSRVKEAGYTDAEIKAAKASN